MPKTKTIKIEFDIIKTSSLVAFLNFMSRKDERMQFFATNISTKDLKEVQAFGKKFMKEMDGMKEDTDKFMFEFTKSDNSAIHNIIGCVMQFYRDDFIKEELDTGDKRQALSSFMQELSDREHEGDNWCSDPKCPRKS